MTFTDILTELRIPFVLGGEHHHVRSGWVGMDCVWCSPRSGRFRMGYGPNRKSVHCWTCGYHNIGASLSQASGRPLGVVLKLLRKCVSGAPESIARTKVGGRVVLPRGIDSMKPVHRRYLTERGFIPEEIFRLWGVGGIGLEARLAWRLFIPITQDGVVVSWTTRSLCSDGVRYINARPDQEAVSAKSLLYGEEYCNQSVIVHEGVTDVWRTGPGSVALLGTAYSREQVQRLSKYPVRCIVFDSERDAQSRARRLCRELQGFPGSTIRVELSGKDPAESPEEEIRELRRRYLGSSGK